MTTVFDEIHEWFVENGIAADIEKVYIDELKSVWTDSRYDVDEYTTYEAYEKLVRRAFNHAKDILTILKRMGEEGDMERCARQDIKRGSILDGAYFMFPRVMGLN